MFYRGVSRGGMMKQLTRGVRTVMHMAGRQAAPGSGAAGPEPVGRDSAGRFVGAGGNGSAEAMARMKIGLTSGQRRWVEDEAARRHVPRTVVVRELLDKALTGQFPAGAPEPARDVGPGGVVHGVADLEDAAMAGAAHVGGGDPGGARVPVPESPRVPEVEVVDAEPVHDARGYAGDDGRHPHYRDPALEAARVAAPP